jgi:hypothetical protein
MFGVGGLKSAFMFGGAPNQVVFLPILGSLDTPFDRICQTKSGLIGVLKRGSMVGKVPTIGLSLNLLHRENHHE